MKMKVQLEREREECVKKEKEEKRMVQDSGFVLLRIPCDCMNHFLLKQANAV